MIETMTDTQPPRSYAEQSIVMAAAYISIGHNKPDNLRRLLICTSSVSTRPMVEQYFEQHHNDKELLRSLVKIALEGDESGDAPWCAANVLSDFPAGMLAEHRADLVELGQHPWTYLHVPARQALAKLDADLK
jgi:hypothetical protein